MEVCKDTIPTVKPRGVMLGGALLQEGGTGALYKIDGEKKLYIEATSQDSQEGKAGFFLIDNNPKYFSKVVGKGLKDKVEALKWP